MFHQFAPFSLHTLLLPLIIYDRGSERSSYGEKYEPVTRGKSWSEVFSKSHVFIYWIWRPQGFCRFRIRFDVLFGSSGSILFPKLERERSITAQNGFTSATSEGLESAIAFSIYNILLVEQGLSDKTAEEVQLGQSFIQYEGMAEEIAIALAQAAKKPPK